VIRESWDLEIQIDSSKLATSQHSSDIWYSISLGTFLKYKLLALIPIISMKLPENSTVWED
jgi:hypothetical protein